MGNSWWGRIVKKARGRRFGRPAAGAAVSEDSVPSRIHPDDDEDLQYWSQVLRADPAKVRAAVARVGGDPAAVARELFGHVAVGEDLPAGSPAEGHRKPRDKPNK